MKLSKKFQIAILASAITLFASSTIAKSFNTEKKPSNKNHIVNSLQEDIYKKYLKAGVFDAPMFVQDDITGRDDWERAKKQLNKIYPLTRGKDVHIYGQKSKSKEGTDLEERSNLKGRVYYVRVVSKKDLEKKNYNNVTEYAIVCRKDQKKDIIIKIPTLAERVAETQSYSQFKQPTM